jgi:hypothetical protein
MLNKTDEEMIVKFLQRNYPVSRIKLNNRFKRAIVLDDGAYMLSDGNSARPLKTKLIATLKTVFDCDATNAYRLISHALNI